MDQTGYKARWGTILRIHTRLCGRYSGDLVRSSEHNGYTSEHYTLKAGSVRAPKEYIGSDIQKFNVQCSDSTGPTVQSYWSMSARTYIKRAVTEVKRMSAEVDQQLKTKVTTPIADKYCAELDATPELDSESTMYFQGLIGVLRWIVELGQLDVMVAVAMLSSNLMAPRQGHLEQCLHIFAYLDIHENLTIVFDSSYRTVDDSRFTINDWSQFYPGAAEAVPPNIPRPLGLPIIVTCYCDADHAGCRVTRRSHSGIIVYVNNAPITW
jgi:hypothetical protein